MKKSISKLGINEHADHFTIVENKKPYMLFYFNKIDTKNDVLERVMTDFWALAAKRSIAKMEVQILSTIIKKIEKKCLNKTTICRG